MALSVLLSAVLATTFLVGAPAHAASAPASFQARPDGDAVLSQGAGIAAFGETTLNPGDGPGSAMTDGNGATYSGGYGPLDVVVDLGRPIPVSHVQIDFGRFWHGPNALSLSTDGVAWTQVFAASGADYMLDSNASTETANSLGVLIEGKPFARFVRLQARDWATVHEFSVSGDAALLPPVDGVFVPDPDGMHVVSLGAAVTPFGSATFNPGEGRPETITDGDRSTRAGGLGATDFMIDLGTNVTVDHLRIDYQRFWRGPTSVYTSVDSTNWTLLEKFEGDRYSENPNVGNEAVNTIGFTVQSVEARYLRITAQDWANIAEVVVFSAAGVLTEQVSIEDPSTPVLVGVPAALRASVRPSNATAPGLQWSVEVPAGSDASATIDPVTGVLTATAQGKLVVRATASDGSGRDGELEIEVGAAAATWRQIEFTLASNQQYADPFMDVAATATFTGPDGQILERPAFWDGGSLWKVRFAAPTAGEWTATFQSTNPADTGLAAPASTFTVNTYDGPLEVFRRGFVTADEGGRHFAYGDGSPFFYLGDTHWFMPGEEWDKSNVDGVASQFKYAVDHRAAQGFTVYQSQPLKQSVGLSVGDGVNGSHLAALRNLDQRFAYIADAGLVHANSSFQFVTLLGEVDDATLDALGIYWQARFGAYPVMWTTAQEIDPDNGGGGGGYVDPKYWKRLAKAIADSDSYDHPLTAHLQSQSEGFRSGWGQEPWHDWFAVQTQTADKRLYKSLWDYAPTKPNVTYEAGYEFNPWTTAQARSFGYRAFQNGSYGYGYGVQGVWATNQSAADWFPYGPYYRWFDGLRSNGGEQMEHLGSFYRSLPWWELSPIFEDTSIAEFAGNDAISVAARADEILVAYVEGANRNWTGAWGGSFIDLSGSSYTARWFDPRTGEYDLIAENIAPVGGRWAPPTLPTENDWILLLTDNEVELDPSPRIVADGDETTIFEKGGSLDLDVEQLGEIRDDVEWAVMDRSSAGNPPATIDAQGVLTATADGVVLAKAKLGTGETLYRTVVLQRQDKTEPLAKISSLSLADAGNRQVVPTFSPSNTHDQRLTWEVTELDGVTPTTKAEISVYGVLSLREEGDVLVTATTRDGSNVSAELEYTIEFNDQITNPLLLGATATASSSDYANDYRPQRALTSTHGDWSGWTSATTNFVSFDDPEWLRVDFPEVRSFNTLDVFSTSHDFHLRSYDLEAWTSGAWRKVAQVRDATTTRTTLTFATVETERFRIVAYEGDALGIARISAVEPSFDPALDFTRPEVVLISPVLSGPLPTLALQVDATDDRGLSKVVANIYKDGTLLQSTQTGVDGATIASHAATVALPDGSYVLKYNAHDRAGNVSRTGSFAFAIDGTKPTATIKDGAGFTLKSGEAYDLISFKLYDGQKIDKVTLNGKVKDLSDNVWSDLNFIKPPTFGAISGTNTLVVYDVAGNTQSYTFTLK